MPHISNQPNHLSSYYIGKGTNAVGKSGVLTVGYDIDGNLHILKNGKVQPALDEMADALGFQKSWDLLTKDLGHAYGLVSDNFVRKDIDW